MNIEQIIKKLEKYTNIPRLSFLFESEEYVYMADTMDQINYIFQNLGHIEASKKNLKIYKDDSETIRGIKDTIKYYEKLIDNSLNNLEENYIKHIEKLGGRVILEEDNDEPEY